MSIQFGRWNFDERSSSPKYIESTRATLAPYGPDHEGQYYDKGVHLIYSGFDTTEESVTAAQSYVMSNGNVILWDGRLDNAQDLVGQLNDHNFSLDNDISIVAAAYCRWKTDCFQKLIGDWAISIWDQKRRSLILATDFLGTRHLYYSAVSTSITWSTVLDPLVLLANATLSLNQEYIAGWISSLPAPHLTPYVGIDRVPPACFVTFTENKRAFHKYWDFNGSKRIRYRTDGEYEEQFRELLAQSVRRRLRSTTPILAELSGGMDSSSIVCMADRVTAIGEDARKIDTVSYYSDKEPHWDERPYFRAVEEKRGKTGLHIDVGVESVERAAPDNREPMLWPGAVSGSRNNRQFDWMKQHGHRVVLSGIGGDEFLGGVPTPLPELEDLLSRGRLLALAHGLKVWALVQRRPWINLLGEAASGFVPHRLRYTPAHRLPPVWLNSEFAERFQWVFRDDEQRLRFFGPLPSFQENVGALDAIRRQLACTELHAGNPFEKRYPFLDRDLLEFLFTCPREQLVRPGQRRSLMRRALAGIVPEEILNRRRKAYVTRAPLATIATQCEELLGSGKSLVVGTMGIVVATSFLEALRDALNGKDVPVIPLLRVLALEQWLQSLSRMERREGRTIRFPPSLHRATESLTGSTGSGSL